MALVCLSKLVTQGFNIVGVVPPHHSEATYSLMCGFTNSLKLPLITYQNSLDEIDFLHKIRQLNADIAVVCSYNKKFPQEFLKTTKDGFVNCHPSLLPEYRGANPYSHVLINNEKETGITLHFMDENFDTGNIIAQKRITIDKNETMGTLFNKTNYITAEFLAQFLMEYEKNQNIPSTPQPQGEYPKAPSIDSKNMKNYIDWEKDAQYLERFINALNPFISAMTSFRGIFLKVHTAKAVDKKVKEKPGTICKTKDGLGIATGKGILYLKSFQFGSYMSCDAETFIATFNPQIGEKLN